MVLLSVATPAGSRGPVQWLGEPEGGGVYRRRGTAPLSPRGGRASNASSGAATRQAACQAVRRDSGGQARWPLPGGDLTCASPWRGPVSLPCLHSSRYPLTPAMSAGWPKGTQLGAGSTGVRTAMLVTVTPASCSSACLGMLIFTLPPSASERRSFRLLQKSRSR